LVVRDHIKGTARVQTEGYPQVAATRADVL